MERAQVAPVPGGGGGAHQEDPAGDFIPGTPRGCAGMPPICLNPCQAEAEGEAPARGESKGPLSLSLGQARAVAYAIFNFHF